MDLFIEPFHDAPEKDKRFLPEGICREAALKKGLAPIEDFAFFLKDSEGASFGGVTGMICYNCLYVDELYIDPAFRGQGWGRKLMEAAEAYGRNRRCTFFTVDTMDWEAKEFYEKLGYTVEFARSGFEKNSTLYFMRKNLNS